MSCYYIAIWYCCHQLFAKTYYSSSSIYCIPVLRLRVGGGYVNSLYLCCLQYYGTVLTVADNLA